MNRTNVRKKTKWKTEWKTEEWMTDRKTEWMK